MQNQVFERQLRRFLERGDQLSRDRVWFDFTGELHEHARGLSSTTIYNATRLPNGFASCVAKYAAPTNGSGSNGVLISTVPTFEDSGQVIAAGLSRPTCAVEHEDKPSAPAGLSRHLPAA